MNNNTNAAATSKKVVLSPTKDDTLVGDANTTNPDEVPVSVVGDSKRMIGPITPNLKETDQILRQISKTEMHQQVQSALEDFVDSSPGDRDFDYVTDWKRNTPPGSNDEFLHVIILETPESHIEIYGDSSDASEALMNAIVEGELPDEKIIADIGNNVVCVVSWTCPTGWPEHQDHKYEILEIEHENSQSIRSVSGLAAIRLIESMPKRRSSRIEIATPGLHKLVHEVPKRAAYAVSTPGCYVSFDQSMRADEGFHSLLIRTATEVDAERLAWDLNQGRVSMMTINDTVRYIRVREYEDPETIWEYQIGRENLPDSELRVIQAYGGNENEHGYQQWEVPWGPNDIEAYSIPYSPIFDPTRED